MSYLDLSDAVVSGRWADLVNLYWSPLYPFLIGVVRAAGGIGARGEVTTIHAINFIGFAALLASFEYLLIQCRSPGTRVEGSVLSSRWGSAIAYGLFGFIALTMTPLELTTPDHFSNAAMLLALGAMLRIADASRDTRLRDGVVLGVALGLGFLAKSFTAPWSLICFAAVAVVDLRTGFRRVAVAMAVWAVFFVPWTALLSGRAHRFTFGDTGRLTYAWYVNGHDAPSSHVAPPESRTPEVTALLPGAGLTGDAPGTDPSWYDPARWNASLRPTIGLHDQIGTLAATVAALIASLSVLAYVFFFIAIAPPGASRDAWRRAWIVWLPCLSGIAAYAMVLLTARYIMAFVLAAILAVFATIPIARRLTPQRLVAGLVLSIAPVALLPLIAVGDAVDATRFALSFVASVVAAMLAGAMIDANSVLAWAVKVGVALILAMLAFATSSRLLVLLGATALVAGLVIGARAAARGDAAEGYAFRVQAALAYAVALIFAGRIALRFVRDASALRTAGDDAIEWRIAEDLARRGVTPGMRIALIGPHAESYWARTARVKIVGNVPDPSVAAWWKLPRERQDSLLALFATAGARVAIAMPTPVAPPPDSTWAPLPYHAWIRRLPEPTAQRR